MCGIAGYFQRANTISADTLNVAFEAVSQSMYERGPDGSGFWISDDLEICLLHRRLAIVDLSEAGKQPMASKCGRYIISYNGEIYNHNEIRERIESISAIKWNGHSDTETLLCAFEMFGVDETLEMAIGMFAISLWDDKEKQLYLIRDRFGEKPLYYTAKSGNIFFGSDLKAFRSSKLVDLEIDRDSIASYLRHNYIPAPYSIYKDVRKVKPGSYLRFNRTDVVEVCYYDKSKIFLNPGDRSGTEEELENVLLRAIKNQMMSDVPLGAFLSGGVDSSLIVSLMQAQSSEKIKTFSIGFNDKNFNEAEHAKRVAEHLGTEHTELYVTDQDALDVVSKLAEIYDEPFSDSSQIPTFLVCKMAKEHVTVVLSGDAGDELFCGYNRYIFTKALWSKVERFPMWSRKLTSKLIKSIPVSVFNGLNIFLPKHRQVPSLGDRVHKGADVLSTRTVSELYFSLISHWKDPSSVVLGANEQSTVLNSGREYVELDDISEMMALDTVTYLPDDILVKVDRAAMANSLETRVPFLDHTVFECAWRLPFEKKLSDGIGKRVLKNILYRYVPKELIERPKTGFGVPIDSWLRGPLRELSERLLDRTLLANDGYFNPDIIVNMWNEHKSGRRNWGYHLWDIIMFQLWLEKHHK